MAFIADGISDLAMRARIPAAIAPVYTGGRHVALIVGLEQGCHENSLMRIPTAQLPLSIKLTGHGRIAAICALCQSNPERGIRVQLSRRRINCDRCAFRLRTGATGASS